MEEKGPESTLIPKKPVSSPSENVENAKKEPYASSSHQNPSEASLKERVEVDTLIQQDKNKLDECEVDNWWQMLSDVLRSFLGVPWHRASVRKRKAANAASKVVWY